MELARSPRDQEPKRLGTQQYKRLAMDAYGGQCACCGVSDLVFLTLDHLADNGAAHRRELGSNSIGSGIYRWIIKQGFPEGYQVLCFNCNWAKSHGGCPHVTPVQMGMA